MCNEILLRWDLCCFGYPSEVSSEALVSGDDLVWMFSEPNDMEQTEEDTYVAQLYGRQRQPRETKVHKMRCATNIQMALAF